jgi:hypothetical protein
MNCILRREIQAHTECAAFGVIECTPRMPNRRWHIPAIINGNNYFIILVILSYNEIKPSQWSKTYQ